MIRPPFYPLYASDDSCLLSDFEERVGLVNAEGEKSTAYDIVSTYVKGIIGRFTSSDVVLQTAHLSADPAFFLH